MLECQCAVSGAVYDGEPRFAVLALAVFASLALGLAVLGLHGGLTYALSQRTPELGIRNALGATHRSLMSLILRDTAIVTVSGLVLGLAAAAVVMRAVQSRLFGLEPPDGASFLAASALVVGATLLPCAIASWRVARLAPSEVLRHL